MAKIKTGHAKKLVDNYKKQKIGNKIGKDETRAVWFSREVIEEVLSTSVHGVLPNGLRFYFASYEPFDSSGSRPPKHKQDGSKTTLVIVPTTHKLDDTGMVIQHPYRPGEILPFDLLDDPTARPEYDKTLAEQNDGQICPPPPPLI